MDEYDKNWLSKVWSKAVPTESGCILWTGYCGPTGYGQISYRGRSNGVHRYVYALLREPLETHQHVCHSCDVRNCINPDHMWIGNPELNARDRAAKKRGAWERKTHCPKGHPYDDANTYLTKEGKRNCRACSLARGRIKAGWPKHLALTLPSVGKGERPFNADWAAARRK
jgi:hypothetical protein